MYGIRSSSANPNETNLSFGERGKQPVRRLKRMQILLAADAASTTRHRRLCADQRLDHLSHQETLCGD